MSRPDRAPLATGGPGFWVVLVTVLVLDIASKAWAVDALVPRHIPHEVIGEYLRFTLSYNPGAAFGMSVGAASRWFFGILALVIIGVLLRTTKELVEENWLASIGVPIIIGGALGNFLDRLRYREGVVDFIDVGVGNVRFWTFNVADSAVTVGAVCLIIALWQVERALAARQKQHQRAAQ
jgi:signal peptidase II